ncbi:hypothetical protein LTR10_023076 [Elasticomyces elasticus]|uniref:tRNA(Phe) 7-[(3-amino-3-carboxypropyl)-4-demethylwyosine(37)-N(4)]-methyltransferase n=1 Tax=Exophiala sideris TaxID=1016849 RepID=A0ABR0JLY5_9EURO|nr:hypothetical protein LTR10_023076 [Elasticomyces elasticus]KAK5036351.1 hypothetical protein LTS07_002078 [Exophiala sideris]KAK5041817.1 hypothetical protein LTR13_002484 [Exophiala sideris]KAK5066735.1 hypothetical protein LTR69_002082 [Exophiala sideris]KAK5184793.1 hypothetical protein LTR44_002639 [Eurotiomycetes sp. CCFEE 6388]
MPQPRPPPRISPTFTAKKAEILSILGRSDDDYSDSSPKGSVDEQIKDLIDEINAYDGLVTTSSCAGRVAVFVEGPKSKGHEQASSEEAGNDQSEPEGRDDGSSGNLTAATISTSPGGKGGGRWLYVSHDPISGPHHDKGNAADTGSFTQLFNLSPSRENSHPDDLDEPTSSLRLIHLSFSPLILHIHCATLQHARPLLAAAINAGFRESGVQSLRILDDPEHGVMVAVRTAGLSFETTVGVVGGYGPEQEVMQSVASEDYLAMCVNVVNERFAWNVERRERFRTELRRAMDREGFGQAQNGWEDKEARRARKRQEGLARQKKEPGSAAASRVGEEQESRDDLDDGLGALGID